MERILSIACALLACGPCIGYGAYLWKKRRYVAAIGGLLPGALAVAAAVAVCLQWKAWFG